MKRNEKVLEMVSKLIEKKVDKSEYLDFPKCCFILHQPKRPKDSKTD